MKMRWLRIILSESTPIYEALRSIKNLYDLAKDDHRKYWQYIQKLYCIVLQRYHQEYYKIKDAMEFECE